MPAPKVLTKIRAQDDVVNRLQDHLGSVLNPLLRDMRKAPSVTGSKGGNAALSSLISALASIGLITDQTT